MKIETARKLKPGHVVHYPADRGEPAGAGRVVYVGADEYTNIHGAPYKWVTVCTGFHNSVWPSNRLGNGFN